MNYVLFQTESEVASYMKKMLIGLGFPKPPDNITAFQLFSKLEAKVRLWNCVHSLFHQLQFNSDAAVFLWFKLLTWAVCRCSWKHTTYCMYELHHESAVWRWIWKHTTSCVHELRCERVRFVIEFKSTLPTACMNLTMRECSLSLNLKTPYLLHAWTSSWESSVVALLQVKELMAQYPTQIGKPLLKSRLSDKQWDTVLEVNEAMAQEYRIRREMLLKRLDVTIQSFMWGDKAKVGQSVRQPLGRQSRKESGDEIRKCYSAVQWCIIVNLFIHRSLQRAKVQQIFWPLPHGPWHIDRPCIKQTTDHAGRLNIDMSSLKQINVIPRWKCHWVGWLFLPALKITGLVLLYGNVWRINCIMVENLNLCPLKGMLKKVTVKSKKQQ